MILTVDDIVNSSKQRHPYLKVSTTTNGVGYFQSLWMSNGMPGAGAKPGAVSGVVTTNSTAGSLGQSNPSGSNSLYLGGVTVNMATTGTLILYDRLVSTSGLSGETLSPQTVNTVALTRYTSGADVEVWLECYQVTGADPVNVNVGYTNQNGVSGQVGPSVPFWVSPVAGQMMQLPLAAGDSGVQSVQTIGGSGFFTTGTAGNFGVTLLRRLAEIPINTNGMGLILDYKALGLPQIQNNACIVGMILPSTTSTGLVQVAITTFEG